MKKLALLLFVLVSLLIVFFVLKKYWAVAPEDTPIQSRNLSLAVLSNEQITNTAGTTTSDDIALTSLVPLLPEEILINVHSIDFDKDRFEDQIIAVKNVNSPFIRIIVGLYNPLLGVYERSYELITEIEQARTFSFTVMDITGTHENALIIEGYSRNNESMLQAWLPKRDGDNLELELIVDLKAEGTIFVEQLNRNASYARNLQDGSSFPIWAYTSDPTASEGSLDQLQLMYDWDKDERKYVQKTRTRIAGKTINTQELAKIQDGTEKTFAAFLDSLWAKSTGFIADDNFLLFFDYAEKEIIFLQDGTQEIYSWERSTLRRNGILIYAINKTMSNLSRRIDIALISIDEIRVKTTDELGMTIGSAAVWDGTYKKQNITTAYTTAAQSPSSKDSDIAKLLQTTSRTTWECDNGYDIGFENSIYTAHSETVQETGVFFVFEVQGETFFQFREQHSNGIFTGFYRPEIVEAEAPIENRVGTRIILSPMKVSAGAMEPAVDKILTMELTMVQDD